MKSFVTIAKAAQYVLEIKHSRFIATAVPIADYEDGLAQIAALKKQYVDATHNCYAMVADDLGTQCKYSDDGEPSGTAGAPMLEVLRRKGLRRVLVVVTRYFGGIKLGANGLVGAYTQAVAEVLQTACVVDMVFSAFAFVSVSYEVVGKMPKLIGNAKGIVLATDYGSGATIHFVLPIDERASLQAKLDLLCKGNAAIQIEKEDYYCYDSDGNR